ncbi:MAG: GntR family transcriptional regulator [Woeseia sp.]
MGSLVKGKISSVITHGTPGSQRLERRTTAEDVALVLRARILEGHYAPGEFIRQDDIANQLGVSRVPVREALHYLEADGLVTLVKYRGAVVPTLSIVELTEIRELRQLIESYLMRYAIENITPGQLLEVNAISTKCRRVRSATPEWVELNVQFHLRLYETADRPVALQLLRRLLLRTNCYLRVQPERSPPDKKRSDEEHQQLLELVEARDTDGALALLKMHISSHSERMKESLTCREPSAG